MPVKESLSDYFSFTATERKGILFFLCLIMLLLYCNAKLDEWLPQPDPIRITTIPADIDTVSRYNERESDEIKNHVRSREKDQTAKPFDYATLDLKPFDPNSVTREQLLEMGVPIKSVERVMNFKAKGGRFYRADDISKIYGMDPGIADSLKSFIRIEQKSGLVKTESAELPAVPDLNSIGYRALIKRFDLDTMFVRKLLKFRRDLGGFYSFDQIRQVEGYEEGSCRELFQKCILDSSMISRIRINTVSTEELRRHPYFSGGLAGAIVNYRIAHGPFRDYNDLLGCGVFDQATYRRARPYISFE